MRLTAKLEVVLGPDNDLLRKMLDELLTIDDTDLTTYDVENPILIAAGTKTITFDSVTAAKYVLIIAKDEVQVRLNDAAAPLLTVKPYAAAATGAALSTIQREDRAGVLWLCGVNITEIYLVNPSASATAEVFVAFAGEQA